MSKYLVIGGVRSGKSSYAQSLAHQLSKENSLEVMYIATAEAIDNEMQNRIEHHRATRPSSWQVLEVSNHLGESLKRIDTPKVLLIDCLTLWLNNCLFYDDKRWTEEKEKFKHWLSNTDHFVVMVSNEVGFSITPDNELARRFADEQGWLNQDIAKLAHQVTLTIAGIPHVLKSN